MGFSEQALDKVCNTIDVIGALPLPLKVRSFLLGAKAIPMITYGAHVSKIPKKSIRKVHFVRALWRNRPIHRSKWLVQLLHGCPHRTDPQIATAYNTILDIFRFCFANQTVVDRLRELWPHRTTLKFSLGDSLDNACDLFGLHVSHDLTLRFGDSGPLPLGRVAPRDVAVALQQLARQVAYEKAACTNRKDFYKPAGLLDFHAATLFVRKPTFH